MDEKPRKLKEIIGTNIRVLRLEYGLTIEYLAERLELSPTFVGLVERGQRGMSIESLVKFCKIFLISFDDLLSDSSESKVVYYKTKEEYEIDEINILIQDLKFEKLKFLKSCIYELREI